VAGASSKPTNAKSFCNPRKIPNLGDSEQVTVGPHKATSLTGSTANFVTASSPSLFRQTLPSGTLPDVSQRLSFQTSPCGIQTVFRASHFLLIRAADMSVSTSSAFRIWENFDLHMSLGDGDCWAQIN